MGTAWNMVLSAQLYSYLVISASRVAQTVEILTAPKRLFTLFVVVFATAHHPSWASVHHQINLTLRSSALILSKPKGVRIHSDAIIYSLRFDSWFLYHASFWKTLGFQSVPRNRFIMFLNAFNHVPKVAHDFHWLVALSTVDRAITKSSFFCANCLSAGTFARLAWIYSCHKVSLAHAPWCFPRRDMFLWTIYHFKWR